MHVVIELVFDQEMDCAVRGLWADLAGMLGRPDLAAREIRPHVTLLSSIDMKVGMATRILRDVAARTPPITLTFESIASFLSPQGVVYLSPVITADLLAIQRNVALAAAAAGVVIEPYYQPGRWSPHCTLARPLSSAEVGRAIARCHEVCAPLSGRAEAMAAISVYPERQIEEGLVPLIEDKE
jgi:2'-5' RNA ligase